MALTYGALLMGKDKRDDLKEIQREQNKINQSMDADLDALAQKEIDLANIKAESTTKQIELNKI